MLIPREGGRSSTPSKRRSSIPVACREKTLKFTPSGPGVAPIGELVPRVRPADTAVRPDRLADSSTVVMALARARDRRAHPQASSSTPVSEPLIVILADDFEGLIGTGRTAWNVHVLGIGERRVHREQGTARPLEVGREWRRERVSNE